MKLGDIPQLQLTIKRAKANTTKLVDDLIFGSDKNKRNRSNLKNLEGFSFGVGDTDFEKKVSDSTENFTKLQFVKYCQFFFKNQKMMKSSLQGRSFQHYVI